MARPKKAPDERRGDQLNMRLTAAEHAELERRASAYGLTVAEFTRRAALGYRMPSHVAEQQGQALVATALIRLGVNLNQLARAANAGRLLPHSVAELTERINEELDRLYDRGDRRRPEL